MASSRCQEIEAVAVLVVKSMEHGVTLNEVKWVRKCTFPFIKCFMTRKRRPEVAQTEHLVNRKNN